MKKFVKRLIIGMGTVGALVIVARALENRFIFWPEKDLVGSPENLGLQYENVTLEPAPGVQIHGWYVPHPEARAMVLYLEGNGGNRSGRLAHINLLHGLGCSVLIMDYEGYDGSDGSPSENAVYRDGRAARVWIRQEPAARNLPEVLFGESLGGAVAIRMAREVAPAGLIVDHSFTRMPDMADKVCFGLPVGFLCASQYNSIQSIRYYHGPLLVMHGDKDKFIPIEQGRRLFAAANEPKRFFTIHGAPHEQNELLRIGGDAYRETIARFLDGVEGKSVGRTIPPPD